MSVGGAGTEMTTFEVSTSAEYRITDSQSGWHVVACFLPGAVFSDGSHNFVCLVRVTSRKKGSSSKWMHVVILEDIYGYPQTQKCTDGITKMHKWGYLKLQIVKIEWIVKISMSAFK